jgi:hypothetical protein
VTGSYVCPNTDLSSLTHCSQLLLLRLLLLLLGLPNNADLHSIQADGADEEGGAAAPPPPRPPPAPSAAGGPAAAGGATAAAAGGGGGPGGAAGGAAGCSAVAAAARAQLLGSTPRLRTRLFAVELLLGMFRALGSDTRHRLPTPKQSLSRAGSYGGAAGDVTSGVTSSSSPGDSFTDHLQELVDLGFKLTTGPMVALRPAGARLLQRAVVFWGGVADPDVPELLLLEQYQAQFVAALRAALAPGGAGRGQAGLSGSRGSFHHYCCYCHNTMSIRHLLLM